MKKFSTVAAGIGLGIATMGVGGNVAAEGYDVSDVLPEGCRAYEVGYEGILESSEKALKDAGYLGIEVDGEISNPYEQEYVYRAQHDLKVIGALGSAVRICGYAGFITEEAAKRAGGITALASDADIDEEKAIEAVSDVESCSKIRLSTWVADRIQGSDGDLLLDDGEEAVSLQNALNNKGVNVGFANGEVGSRTLNGFTQLQINEFGKADCLLGSQTFEVLGIMSSTESSSSATDIDRVVIDKSDNTLKAYDNGVLIDQMRISHGDDRTYTYNYKGFRLSGKATTRTGVSKVYRTEGLDYASRTLGGPRGSMGLARFFDGGLAVHAGNIDAPSHGCVRVQLHKMIELAELGFGEGDTVVVQE